MIVHASVAVCESHRCNPRSEVVLGSVVSPGPRGWFTVLIEWEEGPDQRIAATFAACSTRCADRLAGEVCGRELLRQVIS